MKIACLGWGSLIWRPQNLLIHRHWFEDGPFLGVEFTRQSNDGRLTLVISPLASPIRTLWAQVATDNLDTAKESLRLREGIIANNFAAHISSVNVEEETNDPVKLIIKEWAASLKIDAAIWTNLPPKFNNTANIAPTEIEAVNYLHGLDINKRQLAEEYIRRTPKQIDTAFRRRFEVELGWTCIS